MTDVWSPLLCLFMSYKELKGHYYSKLKVFQNDSSRPLDILMYYILQVDNEMQL